MAKKTAIGLNIKMLQTHQVNLEIGKCILEYSSKQYDQQWVLLLVIYTEIKHKILFPFANVRYKLQQ